MRLEKGGGRRLGHDHGQRQLAVLLRGRGHAEQPKELSVGVERAWRRARRV